MDSHGKALLKKFLALGYDPELFKDTYGVSMRNSRNTANLREGLSYENYYDDLQNVRGNIPKFPSYNIPLENPIKLKNNGLYELLKLGMNSDEIMYNFSIENPNEYPAVNSARFFNNLSDEELLQYLARNGLV